MLEGETEPKKIQMVIFATYGPMGASSTPITINNVGFGGVGTHSKQ
jgi:hypothetical protein